jgi:hypothetical protein
MLSLFGMASVQCQYIGPAVQTLWDKSKMFGVRWKGRHFLPPVHTYIDFSGKCTECFATVPFLYKVQYELLRNSSLGKALTNEAASCFAAGKLKAITPSPNSLTLPGCVRQLQVLYGKSNPSPLEGRILLPVLNSHASDYDWRTTFIFFLSNP